MRKLIVLVALTGCMTPLEREAKESSLRVQITRNNVQIRQAEYEEAELRLKILRKERQIKAQ